MSIVTKEMLERVRRLRSWLIENGEKQEEFDSVLAIVSRVIDPKTIVTLSDLIWENTARKDSNDLAKKILEKLSQNEAAVSRWMNQNGR